MVAVPESVTDKGKARQGGQGRKRRAFKPGEARRGKRCNLTDDRIEDFLKNFFAVFIAGISVGKIATRAEACALTANQHRTHRRALG